MNLDTRHNLLSVLLIGAIALLVLLGLLSFWLLGRVDVAAIEPDSAARGIIDRPVAENPALAELSEYAQIVERPVFFADRSLPVMEVAGPGDEEATEPEAAAEIEIPELEASVAGIIITPDVKLAMVTDSASNETLVLREGMAMAGDKSAWKVASIQPRGVQFQTDDGRTEDLELEVETDALKAGARPAARSAATNETETAANETRADDDILAPQDTESQQDAARARAEEIRRRVAERRAQLRAEAERRARQQDDGGP